MCVFICSLCSILGNLSRQRNISETTSPSPHSHVILISRDCIKTLQSACARGLAMCTHTHNLHLRGYRETYERAHSTDKSKAIHLMHRIFCLGASGYCSQCSLSSCCRLLAMVRVQIYISDFGISCDPCVTLALIFSCSTQPHYFALALTTPQRYQCNL